MHSHALGTLVLFGLNLSTTHSLELAPVAALPKRLTPNYELNRDTELANLEPKVFKFPFSNSRLVKVSDSPLAFVAEKFLDPAACEEIIAIAKERDGGKYVHQCYEHIPPESSELMTSVIERIGVLCGSPPRPDEAVPCVRNVSPTRGLGATRLMKAGLHVDSNGNPYRYATALLYLSDVAADGATVFPCSDSDNVELKLACERLLENGHTHTVSCRDKKVELAKRTLIEAAEAREGLSVYPRAGKLLLFYTLDDVGLVDPYSWHGGAAIGDDPWPTGSKWVLQVFKTVPENLRDHPEQTVRFCKESRALHIPQ